jgi:hypothetical protein
MVGLLTVLSKKCRNQVDFSYFHPNTLWHCEDRDILQAPSLFKKIRALTLVCGAKDHGREFGIDLESLFLAWVFVTARRLP